MIRAVIVMNDQGKPRLVKFYDYQPVEKQQELIRSIYGVLCSRAENVSNFIQADPIFGPDARLVYKTYATLYFVFIFDSAENELAMLDLMQVFVETLDKCFSNVCELDIVFNFNKVGKGLKYNSGCPKIYSWLACSIAHDFSSRWRMIEGEKASMLKENKKEQHNLDSTIENPV
ncbi:hypothetical protein CsSME_00009387 [Camellia sinensis var. sinensis]